MSVFKINVHHETPGCSLAYVWGKFLCPSVLKMSNEEIGYIACDEEESIDDSNITIALD